MELYVELLILENHMKNQHLIIIQLVWVWLEYEEANKIEVNFIVI